MMETREKTRENPSQTATEREPEEEEKNNKKRRERLSSPDF
jgi:hypothetical protein